jgi:hypothetical protein
MMLTPLLVHVCPSPPPCIQITRYRIFSGPDPQFRECARRSRGAEVPVRLARPASTTLPVPYLAPTSSAVVSSFDNSLALLRAPSALALLPAY